MARKAGEVLRWVGAGLLVMALVLTWFKLTVLALVALAGAVTVDIGLVVGREKTISQWIHALLPRWGDYAVLAALAVFSWAVFGPGVFLPLAVGVVAGHLFWQE